MVHCGMVDDGDSEGAEELIDRWGFFDVDVDDDEASFESLIDAAASIALSEAANSFASCAAAVFAFSAAAPPLLDIACGDDAVCTALASSIERRLASAAF